MHTNSQPLAEVFGHLPGDLSAKASRYRKNRLCPFNNRVPNCTKDKANDPLGVCSIIHNGAPVITCPIRFREEWLITDDAAAFFFPEGATWSSLTEIRLNDANGKAAGNIDVVLVSYDRNGQLIDFGALEIQAVYISGNVRDPFNHYMASPNEHCQMDWRTQPNYPRPDYLSSSRKRLAPQLLFKGGILHAWKKKIAVALDKNFLNTLPPLSKVPKERADIAWIIYDLQSVTIGGQQSYSLTKVDQIFTEFNPALLSITTPVPGNVDHFIDLLQGRLNEQLETSPTTKIIESPF